MQYTARAYQSKNDLYQIGQLLRRAYSRQKSFNAWSFCRYDIWALRRLAEATAFNDHSWQEYIQLLFDENDMLVGAAFAFDNHRWRKNPEPYALIIDPDHAPLARLLFAWAESSGMFEVEILQSNTFLRDLVELRGYTRSDDFISIREKALADTPPESINLPRDYLIRTLNRSERDCYFEAVHSASLSRRGDIFQRMDMPEVFDSVPKPRSNGHELHLNVLNDQNQIAAFCSVWLDRENYLAGLEPVGTVPQFQKQGLAATLLAYACNRLRELNYPTVRVECWSGSIGANKLYSACGFLETERLYSWKKESSS